MAEDDDYVSEDDSLEATPPSDFLGPEEREPVTYAPRGAFMSEFDKLQAASNATPERLADVGTIEALKRGKWRRLVDRALGRPLPPAAPSDVAPDPELLHKVAEEERAEKARN